MDIKSILPDANIDIRALSPLTLAFVGDGVYELFIRTKILAMGNRPAGELHKIAVGYVKAKSQSTAILKILEALSDEETEIYKRGRNTNIHTVPKNADMNDYRQATGLEALVGYLYITGKNERLNEILEMCFNELSRA